MYTSPMSSRNDKVAFFTGLPEFRLHPGARAGIVRVPAVLLPLPVLVRLADEKTSSRTYVWSPAAGGATLTGCGCWACAGRAEPPAANRKRQAESREAFIGNLVGRRLGGSRPALVRNAVLGKGGLPRMVRPINIA